MGPQDTSPSIQDKVWGHPGERWTETTFQFLQELQKKSPTAERPGSVSLLPCPGLHLSDLRPTLSTARSKSESGETLGLLSPPRVPEATAPLISAPGERNRLVPRWQQLNLASSREEPPNSACRREASWPPKSLAMQSPLGSVSYGKQTEEAHPFPQETANEIIHAEVIKQCAGYPTTMLPETASHQHESELFHL